MSGAATYALVGLICFLFACLRYLAMTGIYYFTVYKFFWTSLRRFKIQQDFPRGAMMKHEMYWALVNNVNFAIVGMFAYFLYERGMLQIYFDLSEYGILYYALLIPGLLLAHDAYFFWIHWLMHKTPAGRWMRHDIHHGVDNVSPWSAFSVHPFEGLAEVSFRVVVLLAVPMHPLVFVLFELLTFALNIIGHSGYEFFPANFATSPLTRMNSSATFHYLHHLNGGTNFSLFFNHWDRLMGTFNPAYEAFYRDVVEERNSHDQRAIHTAGLPAPGALALAPDELVAPVSRGRDPGGRDLA